MIEIDANNGLECKRPMDGFYNGNLQRAATGPCVNWHFVLFEYASTFESYETIRDLSAFAGDNSWEDLGESCR